MFSQRKLACSDHKLGAVEVSLLNDSSEKFGAAFLWAASAVFIGLIHAVDTFGGLAVRDWIFGQTGAAWVQAIGSIGAILSAIAVVKRQHESQLSIAAQVERDRQILMSTRGLLACDAFMNSISFYATRLKALGSSPIRHYRFLELGTMLLLVPMDLDSLAFLVNKSASDVLIAFSQVNGRDRYLVLLLEGLETFCAKEINPVVMAAEKRLERHLRGDELIDVVGEQLDHILRRRTADIERLSFDSLVSTASEVRLIRSRLSELYPLAIFPVAPVLEPL